MEAVTNDWADHNLSKEEKHVDEPAKVSKPVQHAVGLPCPDDLF